MTIYVGETEKMQRGKCLWTAFTKLLRDIVSILSAFLHI